MPSQIAPTTAVTPPTTRATGEGPERAGAVRGRAGAGRVEDDRGAGAGALLERLVGEVPDRPDPERGRGGAGERVAMLAGYPHQPLKTRQPHRQHNPTPFASMCPDAR